MTERVGFYPGSFDPVTNGHLDVIERACKLVDRLIVGIGVHAAKKPMLTAAQRRDLLVETAGAIGTRKGVKIEIVEFDGLMVHAAQRLGAGLVIRGLRDTTDYNYEMQMVGMNAQMAPDIQTVFVPSSPYVRHISATLVRQIAEMGGDVSPFVPRLVLKLLEQ
ncbi:pantetheine-phosphate adenylyltransferase [Pelagibacterium sp. 26DY04]|uniref:pantetheine-phosphate adenylyltransferase n=1 Tax=unclassified Pelagibacterium TaxID=2623280 RepID=UPI00281576BA|nr:MULTISPECIES: pantetheine-phosphate adenylyltransferase [unclassified Pelagibacterium]WMT88799.1 pantetheine-phosphate adenylyltransferase [Pelagibacterium sp. 26DY04]WMT90543.1 pantetheine-phosphate adenylyltransferase [Pelagibacterium sp. H642]